MDRSKYRLSRRYLERGTGKTVVILAGRACSDQQLVRLFYSCESLLEILRSNVRAGVETPIARKLQDFNALW